ncbi:hypothetical protein Droror1_Dr00011343 [Drosera rotundifolia]
MESSIDIAFPYGISRLGMEKIQYRLQHSIMDKKSAEHHQVIATDYRDKACHTHYQEQAPTEDRTHSRPASRGEPNTPFALVDGRIGRQGNGCEGGVFPVATGCEEDTAVVVLGSS